MNEEEIGWPIHLNGEYMRHVLTHTSPRKLRLYTVANCRALWAEFTDPACRSSVEAAELFADGLVDHETRRTLAEAAYLHAQQLNSRAAREGMRWLRDLPYANAGTPVPRDAIPDAICWSVAMAAANSLNEDAAHSTWATHGLRNAIRFHGRRMLAEHRLCKRLAPEVFGLDPLNPVSFDPRWRSESAVALARTAYETRNFTLMPILADALEDAGCDHPDVLAHCREPNGVHVRGCWVVDGVLGMV